VPLDQSVVLAANRIVVPGREEMGKDAMNGTEAGDGGLSFLCRLPKFNLGIRTLIAFSSQISHLLRFINLVYQSAGMIHPRFLAGMLTFLRQAV
jgi:hypothetical protein